MWEKEQNAYVYTRIKNGKKEKKGKKCVKKTLVRYYINTIKYMQKGRC